MSIISKLVLNCLLLLHLHVISTHIISSALVYIISARAIVHVINALVHEDMCSKKVRMHTKCAQKLIYSR